MEFKPIKGYEGIYEACSDGTIWTCEGKVTYSNWHGKIRKRVWKRRELKPQIQKRIWGDYFTIYIDNVVNFSAWLQARDVEPITEETNAWTWLDELVEKYSEEQEDE